ncbi:MAG: 5'-3' exonuclease [Kiritimatiellaeota bacterium]|nr:5'-3' exonuclease [Kiritimatiellota bacterium]
MNDDGDSRVLLIDGYGQIYRAFYAIRELSNRRGDPTNALFGVARFLAALEKQAPHQYGAFVLDRGKPEARLALLPEYKATRPPMPEALLRQLPAIREWITASGWLVMEKEGWEADDLMAAAACALRDDHEVWLVSRDKDLAQVVGGNVVQIVPGNKGRLERWGIAEVEAKFGVPPASLADYLALVGDASDNIPGVPGVGAKTAAVLLQRYNNIDNLLAHLDEVEPARLRDKLGQAKDLLIRNRKLVTLKQELPPDWPGPAGLKRRPPDWDELLGICEENDLHSLRKELIARRDAFRSPSLF